mmetsp:Transcript_136512/g.272270  ORF Transcript_136512/g.272270 Transcript_136512/m.272270 type:complete len:310 (+) Transcript_136512:439-1368(+)
MLFMISTMLVHGTSVHPMACSNGSTANTCISTLPAQTSSGRTSSAQQLTGRARQLHMAWGVGWNHLQVYLRHQTSRLFAFMILIFTCWKGTGLRSIGALSMWSTSLNKWVTRSCRRHPCLLGDTGLQIPWTASQHPSVNQSIQPTPCCPTAFGTWQFKRIMSKTREGHGGGRKIWCGMVQGVLARPIQSRTTAPTFWNHCMEPSPTSPCSLTSPSVRASIVVHTFTCTHATQVLGWANKPQAKRFVCAVARMHTLRAAAWWRAGSSSMCHRPSLTWVLTSLLVHVMLLCKQCRLHDRGRPVGLKSFNSS